MLALATSVWIVELITQKPLIVRTKTSLMPAVKLLVLTSPEFPTDKGKPGLPALQTRCTVADEFRPIPPLQCWLALGGEMVGGCWSCWQWHLKMEAGIAMESLSPACRCSQEKPLVSWVSGLTLCKCPRDHAGWKDPWSLLGVTVQPI